MRDEHEAFDLCLREQHAIERIGVMWRKEFDRSCVIESNRQLDEPALIHALGKRLRQSHSAECGFDGDLPR